MSKPKYTVIVQNKSGKDGFALLFAQQSAYPVWQSKFTYNDVNSVFEWQENFGFVWQQYGAKNNSQQILPTDLKTNNEITLDYDAQHQAFRFKDQKQGNPPGTLIINQSSTIPSGTVRIGLAIAGYPAAMQDSHPNSTLTIVQCSKYYVAFDVEEQTGVVNVNKTSKLALLKFPPNIYSLTATINEDFTWTVNNTPLRMSAIE
jgi:hypothetical protein